MDKIFAQRFKLIRKIGAGSFGQIYICDDLQNHTKVALKLESSKNQSPQLPYEAKLYGVLEGCSSVPRLYYYGSEGHYNVMAIDLLEKSLEDHLNDGKNKFSLKTTLMLADQMISAVEFIHNKNYIHRDIKPDNFVMGTGKNSNKVYVIDFGLSKRYRDQFTHQHIPWIDGKSLTGTARYASVNALRGVEQSRRDDMEALGYVWIYLMRGSLPWMGLKAKDQRQKYEKICDVKARTPIEELCRGFPEEFVTYFKEIKKLHFTDTPNYALYKQMFRSLFLRMGFTYDGVYDWTIQKERLSSSKSSNSSFKLLMQETRNTLIKNESQPFYPPVQRQKELQVPYISKMNQDLVPDRNPSARRIPKKSSDKEEVRRVEATMLRPITVRKQNIQDTTLNYNSRVETQVRLENPQIEANPTNKPEKLYYGPPRVLRRTQLPRWMGDFTPNVSRVRL
ncbi:CK1 family protein kinase [Trichomonas vaginalis G3]|uniref:non-specific serine/threonine protein kinase n=1 Tax=Trichomonas vaginalis (strain ATCC PRA-98 / G3) TaxID=412133 RepID=A2DRE5_TRIV3|nr:STKc CK1 domain-containing protein [Trichomonas vaginalis G3]EAY17071.1 CK1 family protein kinase [Trichomonas vaginalis G3]KAI5517943.1 STKc CK1 domain-containing protein [Trichomonas vaginalis G3]|eukprot:XP_001329294.1 CK1 family protein kinase [Trichomonas vaginalis G3]